MNVLERKSKIKRSHGVFFVRYRRTYVLNTKKKTIKIFNKLYYKVRNKDFCIIYVYTVYKIIKSLVKITYLLNVQKYLYFKQVNSKYFKNKLVLIDNLLFIYLKNLLSSK